MNNLQIVKMFRSYKVSEVLKSFAVMILFFVLIGTIFLAPIIATLFLYVPYLVYFFLGMYIILAFLSVYVNNIYVETLKNYNTYEEIDYEKFKIRASVVMSILVFIILATIYISVQ